MHTIHGTLDTCTPLHHITSMTSTPTPSTSSRCALPRYTWFWADESFKSTLLFWLSLTRALSFCQSSTNQWLCRKFWKIPTTNLVLAQKLFKADRHISAVQLFNNDNQPRSMLYTLTPLSDVTGRGVAARGPPLAYTCAAAAPPSISRPAAPRARLGSCPRRIPKSAEKAGSNENCFKNEATPWFHFLLHAANFRSLASTALNPHKAFGETLESYTNKRHWNRDFGRSIAIKSKWYLQLLAQFCPFSTVQKILKSFWRNFNMKNLSNSRGCS